MVPNIISRLIILLFGALYPAYKSYKAIKYKNVKEVVRLTMHWIVFSMFLVLESVADLIIFWFPFYYDIKCLIVIYLVLPFTQGSSIIYRKIVHPSLNRKETEIDEAIENATETGFAALKQYGSKGFTYAAAFIVNTALMGQDLISNHLRNRSMSMDDLFFRRNGNDPKPPRLQTDIADTENKYYHKLSAPLSGANSMDNSQSPKALSFDHQLLPPNSVLYNVHELDEEEEEHLESLSRSHSQTIQRSNSTYGNSRMCTRRSSQSRSRVLANHKTSHLGSIRRKKMQRPVT